MGSSSSPSSLLPSQPEPLSRLPLSPLTRSQISAQPLLPAQDPCPTPHQHSDVCSPWGPGDLKGLHSFVEQKSKPRHPMAHPRLITMGS
jgi:hypothetical protein